MANSFIHLLYDKTRTHSCSPRVEWSALLWELKALCDQWGVEVLGLSYAKLRNYGLSQDKPYVSQNFVIRKGKIITSKKEI